MTPETDRARFNSSRKARGQAPNGVNMCFTPVKRLVPLRRKMAAVNLNIVRPVT